MASSPPSESLKRARTHSMSSVDADSSSKRCASEGPPDSCSSDARGGIEHLSLASSPRPPPPLEEQARTSKEQIERPLALGHVWYLLPRNWQRDWEHACLERQLDEELSSSFDGVSVGPINTTGLVDSNGELSMEQRPQEGVDYTLIHEMGWDLLTSW
jgi:DUSP domain